MTERQDVRPLTTEDLVQDNRTQGSAERYDRVEDNRVEDDRVGDDRIDNDTNDTVDTTHDDTVDETRYDDTTNEEPTQVEESLPQNEERAPTDDDGLEGTQLFAMVEIERFRDEWRALQSDFVDSPREAVQHADELVAQVIQSLATTFADHKRTLEGQWNQGEQVDTEELRIALRRYRSFFDQLLTV